MASHRVNTVMQKGAFLHQLSSRIFTNNFCRALHTHIPHTQLSMLMPFLLCFFPSSFLLRFFFLLLPLYAANNHIFLSIYIYTQFTVYFSVLSIYSIWLRTWSSPFSFGIFYGDVTCVSLCVCVCECLPALWYTAPTIPQSPVLSRIFGFFLPLCSGCCCCFIYMTSIQILMMTFPSYTKWILMRLS